MPSLSPEKLARAVVTHGTLLLAACSTLPEEAKKLTDEQQELIDASVALDEASLPVVEGMIDAMPGPWIAPEGATNDPQKMKAAIRECHDLLLEVWKNDRFYTAHTDEMPLAESEAMEIDLNRIDGKTNDIFFVLNVDMQDSWEASTLEHEACHLRFLHDATIEGEILEDTKKNWNDPVLSEIILDHADFSYTASGLFAGTTGMLKNISHDREKLLTEARDAGMHSKEFSEALILPDQETWIRSYVENMLSWNAFPEVAGIPQSAIEDAVREAGWYDHEVEARAELAAEYTKELQESRREAVRELRVTSLKNL